MSTVSNDLKIIQRGSDPKHDEIVPSRPMYVEDYQPLRGFPRKYAEMYKDYLHPITDVLSSIEKSVDIYLESN